MSTPLIPDKLYAVNQQHIDDLIKFVRAVAPWFTSEHHATRQVLRALTAGDPLSVATMAAHLIVRAAFPPPQEGETL